MTVPDRAYLQRIATECVSLVASQFDRNLDWSLASLGELDAVCEDLLADGPLSDERLDLWWKLIGAYRRGACPRLRRGVGRPREAIRCARGLGARDNGVSVLHHE